MVDFSTILAGFGDAFTLWNLSFVLFGVVVGQFVGAVPGIGPVMAMAIALLTRIVMLIDDEDSDDGSDLEVDILSGRSVSRPGMPAFVIPMCFLCDVAGEGVVCKFRWLV